MAFFLLSAEYTSLPFSKEEMKDWKCLDQDRFSSYDFLLRDYVSYKKLDEIPPEKINEDTFAKFWREGNFAFRSKSGDQVIVMDTGTDCTRIDTYFFKKNNTPPDLDPYSWMALEGNMLCTPNKSKCIKVKDSKKFLQKKISLAPVVEDKYFVTEKGIKLGMGYDEVIKIYGKPDKIKTVKSPKNRIECSWLVYKIDDDYQGKGFILTKKSQITQTKKEKGWISQHYNYDYSNKEGFVLKKDGYLPIQNDQNGQDRNNKATKYFESTIDFVNGQVEQIHFSYFYPG